VHKKGLISSVATGLGGQTDTVDYTPGISINNKNGLVSAIKYYGIGGLRADTMNGKQLLAEVINTISPQLIKVIAVALSQPVGQGLEL
jgi:hypothetical protein